MRLLVRRRFQEGARGQLHQAAIAGLARGQQHDPRQRARRARRAADRASSSPKSIASAQPTIGWMPIAGELFGEFQRPEHVVGVGQRQRRLVVGLGEFGELADRSARLRAANRRNARADARSRGRRVTGMASAIRFRAMVGIAAPPCPPSIRNRAGCPMPADPSTTGEPRMAAVLRRWAAVMAREPGKPCFRCHPRPIGDGGWTWIPAADGYDERGTDGEYATTQRYRRDQPRTMSQGGDDLRPDRRSSRETG